MPTFHCIHCGQRIDAPESMSGKNADCPTCASSITVPGVSISPPVVPTVKQKTPRKKQSIFTVVLLIVIIVSGFSYTVYKLSSEEENHYDTYRSPQTQTVIDKRQQKQNPTEIDGYDQDLIDAGFTKAQIQENQRNARVHGVPWAEYKKTLLGVTHGIILQDK